MKKVVAVLAGLLLLTAAGCTASDTPAVTQPSTTTAVVTTTATTTTTLSVATLGTTTTVVHAGLRSPSPETLDELVTTLPESTEVCRFPQIHIDCEAADIANAEMLVHQDDVWEADYTSFLHGSVVTVLQTEMPGWGDLEFYSAYNIDKDAGAYVTNEQLLALCGTTEEAIFPVVEQAMYDCAFERHAQILNATTDDETENRRIVTQWVQEEIVRHGDTLEDLCGITRDMFIGDGGHLYRIIDVPNVAGAVTVDAVVDTGAVYQG